MKSRRCKHVCMYCNPDILIFRMVIRFRYTAYTINGYKALLRYFEKYETRRSAL